MLNLSKRLQRIADFVEQGSIVSDIGTDHGYLAVYLVQKGISPRVVAADINQGPLESAESNVRAHGLQDQIELRLGNGLQILKPGEVDTIIIAGMGGGTMRDILHNSPEVTRQARRLILQPMADEPDLRRYLYHNGWNLVDEELLMEDGRLYLIMVAEQGQQEVHEPIVMEVGPRLLEKRHPLLGELLQRLKQKDKRVLDGLAKSSQEAAKAKAVITQQRIKQLGDIEKSLGLS